MTRTLLGLLLILQMEANGQPIIIKIYGIYNKKRNKNTTMQLLPHSHQDIP